MEVIVLDLSLLGCRIEHPTPLRVGTTVRLSIREEGGIEMECTVMRCTLDPMIARGDNTVYQSGLRFARAVDDASERLRALIAREVTTALNEQKANAHGELPSFMRVMLDAARLGDGELQQFTMLPYLRVARARGYVTYALEKNVWRKRRSQNPTQPQDGFTVWAYEDEEELELLARTYEHADFEMRTLIRMCAELSLVTDDTIPPQRFMP